MSDESTPEATPDETPTLTRSEERAALAAQAAADKADAAAVVAAEAAAAAEAARNAIALTYTPGQGGEGAGVPRRDLTVQEAEVYLATREAVAGLCAYGAYTPTDALPADLRPEATKE